MARGSLVSSPLLCAFLTTISSAALLSCFSIPSPFSSAASNTTIRLKVSHIYGPRSPLRPAECHDDDACVWELHRQRLQASSHVRRVKRFTNRTPTTVIRSNLSSNKMMAIPGSSISIDRGMHPEGMYYLLLDIGRLNTQTVLLQPDSGSDLLWVQCDPCDPCFNQSLPVFDPYDAGSRFLIDIDVFCQTVQEDRTLGNGSDSDQCNFKIVYTDATMILGKIVTDRIAFEDMKNPNLASSVSFDAGFGCGFANYQSVPTLASGILGLSRGVGVSLPEQLGVGFSYCLPSIEDEGFLILGPDIFSINATYNTTDFLDVPPPPGRFFRPWYLDVIKIIVATLPLPLQNDAFKINNDGSGGTIIDSGSSLNYLSSTIYYVFRDAWRGAIQPQLPNIGAPYGSLDTCYDLPSPSIAPPIVSLVFRDGKEFRTRKTFNYVTPNGTFRICWPYELDENGGPSITLGAIAQQNTRMIYDTNNLKFGWQYRGC